MQLTLMMRFFYIFFLICLHFSFAQENINRILHSPFPVSQKPDTLYVIYDQNFSENEILSIQSLQGILSQEKPLIYRDVGTGSSIWINDLIENHNIIPNYSIDNNFEELISLFKSKIEGYIICDLHTHSSNIATTLSGIYHAIIVTSEHVKLMTELNIPMIYDVRSKDYSWVLNNYAKSVNTTIKKAGINSEVDLKNHNLNYKIREHSLSKIPVLLICGKKEVDSNSVTIRRLDSDKQENMDLDLFLKKHSALSKAPSN